MSSKFSHKASIDPDASSHLQALHRDANKRKRLVYWIGFLKGVISSKGIEQSEGEALFAEAEMFQKFFRDPDACDLLEDLKAGTFSSEEDTMTFLSDIIEAKEREVFSSDGYSEKDDINQFLGFCAGIICDGRILQKEAEAILDEFRKSNALMTSPAFADLRRSVEAALADGVLTDDEGVEVQDWITQLVGDGYADTGVPSIGAVARLDSPILDPHEVQLSGKVFVLTGPMKMGVRSFIHSEIDRVGGVPEAGISQRTDYLLVSSTASRHWISTHFGTKIERGRELIDEGHKVRFVSENALAGAIKLHDQVETNA